MKHTTHLFRQTALVLVMLFTAVTVSADPWKFQTWKSHWSSYNDQPSLSFGQLYNGFPKKCRIEDNIYEGGSQFIVDGISQKESKMTIMSIYSHTENVPSYTRRELTWDYSMFSRVKKGHIQNFAFYASDSELTIKSMSVDCTENYSDGSSSQYCISKTPSCGPNEYSDKDFKKKFSFDNRSSSTANYKSCYLMMVYTIFNGGKSKEFDQSVNFNTKKYSWKDYYYKEITFNGNGGSSYDDSMTNQTIENKGNLKACTMIRGGYCFIGWNTKADGSGTFYTDKAEITATSTDKGPVTLYAQWASPAKKLSGVFNQSTNEVHLSWNAGSIPGNFKDYQWVVYRDGQKLGAYGCDTRSYVDVGMTTEAIHTYDIYFVSNNWNEGDKREGTKASVTVDCTRKVPVNNLHVIQMDDRLVFTWSSDVYPIKVDNKFYIFVDEKKEPIDSIKPSQGQSDFQWEHRTTDQHIDPQHGTDPETGVPYIEEQLDVCNPHDYRIEGLIGSTVLNTDSVSDKAIGEGTKFFDLDASKGVYEGVVKITWHVNNQGSIEKTYTVLRRVAGNNDSKWTSLAQMKSADDYLSYTDETALPGVFYDYKISVEDKCSDGNTFTNDINGIGFAKSTGTVTGRIAYGSSGVAVKGVDVVMKKASSGDDKKEQFHSMYFTDNNGVVTWKYPSADYATERFAKGDFSVQLWLYPESVSNDSIVKFGNGVSLNMTASGGLAFTDGTDTKAFDGIELTQNTYNHLTLTRSGTQMTCYVVTINDRNEPNVQKASIALTDDLQVGSPKQFELGHFKGSADEFRLWTKCLSEEDIMENYDHLLVGNEEGLETYWTFDEGLSTHFFDYSRSGTDYHKHHGTGVQNATPSARTPSALALRAKTDADGNYVIQGVPFSEAGTTYTVTPLYGIHDFNPSKSVLFVAQNALVHNKTDFEDVSSFPMEGYVYYAGTNIPAEGIQLYIDGDLVTGNGEVKKTDAAGFYSISVPIGKHYVEAKLDGHTMVADGRFPTLGTFNFDRAVTYDFADSTLVNFVGRVGGGERNDTLAVGFGASKNNIGIATVKLELNNESMSFNCADDHISDAQTRRTWDSDTISINSTAWTGTGADSKYIYIRTDSLTGEFSALLPPLKYFTKSVSIDRNSDIEFSSLSEIDLTNPRKELTDSLNSQRYSYNTKQVWTYYAQPQLDVSEKGYEPGIFGLREKHYTNNNDGSETVISDLWKIEEDGSVSYLLGYPIYETGDTYNYNFHAYEQYINYDGEQNVADIIPLNGQTLTITNEMSSSQRVVYRVDDPDSSEYKEGDVVDVQDIELELDSVGCGRLNWQVGFPNITSPYTRHFAVSMKRNDRTYVLHNMDAIVLGALTNGDNFITKGPDIVQFVLRDPPGAKSKTTLKKGQVVSKTHYKTKGSYGDESFVTNVINGISSEIATGFGVMVLSSAKSSAEIDAGYHCRWEYQHNRDTTTTVTTVEAVSTSAAYPYVGSAGDVYVGTSYNMIVGSCRNLLIRWDSDTQQYIIALEDALSLGNEIATSFKYSQYEIETVMIPKWEDQRNAFLTQVATKAEADAYQNSGKQPVYLSWKEKGTPGYGEEGNYRFVAPENPEETCIDSVLWCNNQIEQWRKCIKENEENKVNSIENKTAENFSIDGGSSYTYSKRDAVTKNDSKITSWKMGLVAGYHVSAHIESLVKYGFILNFNTENGGQQIYGDGTKTESFTEWEYHVEDGNRDTDLSINKYASDTNGYSDIFYLYGGQTYNPFEDKEVTKYYEPGKPLGNGTEQMEQPYMSISITGQNPSKNVTVTDIASGQEAHLTLHCTNMARVHQGTNFSYNVVVPEAANTNGLQILMDGVPISGRSISLPQGETVTKQITIRQTDQSILDYEGIRLRFCSQYQPGLIYDDVTINAHFKPSSSPIDLAITEPVLNTESEEGKLSLKLTNFDRLFKNLRNVGVQYRFEGNTQWTDLHTWVTDKADSTGTSFNMLPETGDIRYAVDMSSDVSYPEGNYEFRAFTTTPYGTEQVQVFSDVVKVVKDLTRPRNLFTPAPSNGILNYGDQMAIEFNEDIVPGYVSDKNVIVTAKLNQQTVNHEVALHLQPDGDASKTENPVFLSGDFALDFWFNWHESGTLLHSGADNNKFALGIDKGNHFVITVAGNSLVSTATLPKDEWIFLALNFKADSLTFDVLALYNDKDGKEQSVKLFNNLPVTTAVTQTVNAASDNYLYLGNINADMHALSLYDISHGVDAAAAVKNQTKDGYVYGLVNYWPMEEGHGNMAADMRHTHNFIVPDSWKLENVNYALHTGDTKGATANISNAATTHGDSYAIEMWYKRGSVPTDATSKEQVVFKTDTLKLSYNEQQDLVLKYGEKTQTVASHKDFPNDTEWRHMALNVVRGQAASFYLNGQRTAVIAEADVPPIQGSQLIIGQNAKDAEVDEVRIWHAALSESRLTGNIYNAIDTADVYSRGLVAYYPFEEPGNVNGVDTKVPTMQNMAKGKTDIKMSAGISELVLATPPVKNAPEESRLIASPVASERKVVINLTGAGISPRDIEGTTLNITVDKIHDLHGNTSLPIRWTAYVRQNTLTWTKDSVNIYKMYGDEYTFDVDIENKSGNVEYYTLYNMPQWLSLVDSEQTDDIQPLRKKTLRFMVNPLVNIGNYDVTIGLQGNNEILEPLRIVMKVRGEMPDWAVDPMEYENQMTITGQMRIGGILVENPDSRVAAFINGKCRGVAAPKQIRGTAYVPLSIYGTAYQEINNKQEVLDLNQTVTFRIWDASTGVAYTNVSLILPEGTKDTLHFNPVNSYGTFDQPVIFTQSQYVEQPLSLKQGWNWFSLGVQPEKTNVQDVFGDLTSWIVRLKDQTTGTAYCDGSSWSGYLKQVSANKMYKMFLSRRDGSKELPQPLIVIGKQVDPSKESVTLKCGWNWIPYTPTVTMTLDEALAGANPKVGDMVKSQYGFACYGPYGWEGNLEVMESGKGYLYKSVDDSQTDKSFVYPTVANGRQMARRTHKARRAPAVFTPVDPTSYPDNMSMVIKLVSQDEPVANAEVAAFIGEECRGVATGEDGLYYLLIAGEGSGQPIELCVAYGDEILRLNPSITYSSDGNVGTPWEPLVIDLQDTQTGINGIMADDGDEEDWYSLQGIKLQRKPTHRGVYLRGQVKTTVTQ